MGQVASILKWENVPGFALNSSFDIKRRYCWGGKLWTQSYFVETIGDATEDTIRKYVQNQMVELDRKEVHGSQLGLC